MNRVHKFTCVSFSIQLLTNHHRLMSVHPFEYMKWGLRSLFNNFLRIQMDFELVIKTFCID